MSAVPAQEILCLVAMWQPTGILTTPLLAAMPVDFFGLFSNIFIGVVLPILILAATGIAMQRLFTLDMSTLSRLNIYLFVPVFLFIRVYDSALTVAQIVLLAVVTTLSMVLIGLGAWGVMRARRVPGPEIGVILLSGVIYNAGNFGIPVAELLYRGDKLLFQGMSSQGDGPAVQGILVMLSNLAIWCLGYSMLTYTQGRGSQGFWNYFKLPMFYVVVAAFLLRWMRQNWMHGVDPLPHWIRYPLEQVAAGLVPFALITLGAQLGKTGTGKRRWNLVGPATILKLVILPVGTAALVIGSNYLPWPQYHLWPWPGAQIIIAAAGPSAVNTLLITLEVDGDSDLAASCVFWTTLLSAVTVTLTIVLVLKWGGAG